MTLASRAARTLAVLLLAVPAAMSAQGTPAPQPALLKVGDAAPDFTVTTVTAGGVESKPFRLADHRGETVVLAFFPKARTSGCTVQMHAYRDRYEELFAAGKKVTVVGVSVDPDTALVSWAKDDRIPFRFAADVDRKVGVAYGASAGSGFHRRTLYVIDPSGKVAYVTERFNQMSADAYTELGKAVAQAGGAR